MLSGRFTGSVIALVSTIGEVKKALGRAGELRAIVSPASYSIPPRLSFDELLRWEFAMNQEGNLAFPYLFKESGYKYEDEVRFVLAFTQICWSVLRESLPK
jgi:hypothetical protein